MHHVTPESKFVVASPVSVAVPPPEQQAGGSADRLDRIIAMLERVLEQQPQHTGLFSRGDVRARQNQATRAKPFAPCDICGDLGHTTYYHCKANNLCFVCHASDHTRVECPRAVAIKRRGTKPASQQEGN